MLHAEAAFRDRRMKIGTVIALTLVVANLASADDRRFTASALPAARLKQSGRVVITNDGHSITAYRFFGNIRESLVSLRSSRVVSTNPYGPAVYDSRASVIAPDDFASAIEEAGRTHGVDPRLVAAVARRESAWNVNAISRTGACGLMQLMPQTARFLGVTNVFDPRENIFGGARYLRTLLDAFNGDLDLTLAAYNAGPGAVEKYRGIPPYRETQAYVAAVKATYQKSLRQGS
jgi:soluble lytic murein transglycosylase-like protein